MIKTFKQKNPDHRIYKAGEKWFIYCCKLQGTYLKELSPFKCLCCSEGLK
jgi:hypothetical protein